MKQVKVTDFRAQLPKYLARAKAGETVTVFSHGRPVARLVPAAGMSEGAKDRLVALRRKARIGDVVSPIAAEWSALHGRS